MLAQSAVAVALLATFGIAANTVNSTIDPNSITQTLRSQWCQGEQNTCPILCGGQASTTDNDCDVDTLDFTCTCSNGSAPGLQFYTQTMPTFICEQIFQNCIAAGAGSQSAQQLCTNAEATNCGHNDPSTYVAPVSSSSSASATPTSASAAATSPVSSTSSKAAAATMVIAREYGTGLFVAGAAAAFGMML